jgi:hypothetical protein
MPFDFALRYNEEAKYWYISITNAINNQNLISDVPLIAGVYPAANLLEQFEHLHIGAVVLVKINPDNPDDAPNANNLGIDFALVWSDNL